MDPSDLLGMLDLGAALPEICAADEIAAAVDAALRDSFELVESPVGADGILSLLVTASAGTLALLLALFCGFFLHIGASGLLPESHRAYPRPATTVA